ncbi:hypothetical protein Tco_1292617 [Tanacetum coccineum]
MLKPRFASQVDVNNNLSRLVTQHYLPKIRESIFAKPDYMIASSESRNRSKNMPRFSLNDMVHNQYLDEARKRTHKRDRNSKTSVMPSARFQSTADGSKPKPRNKGIIKANIINKARYLPLIAFILGTKDLCCSFNKIPELLLYIPLLEKEYAAISWMVVFASATVLDGMAPLESRICRVGTSNPL